MGKLRSAITRFIFAVLLLGISLLLVDCGAEAIAYGMVLTEDPEAPTGITLSAASGATIEFRTQNGETVDGVPAETMQIPHLVLHRNGALTAAPERTLVVKVSGIAVPPGGVTVTLAVETQHGDPDRWGTGVSHPRVARCAVDCGFDGKYRWHGGIHARVSIGYDAGRKCAPHAHGLLSLSGDSHRCR